MLGSGAPETSGVDTWICSVADGPALSVTQKVVKEIRNLLCVAALCSDSFCMPVIDDAHVNKGADMIFLIAHNRVSCRQMPRTQVLPPVG